LTCNKLQVSMALVELVREHRCVPEWPVAPKRRNKVNETSTGMPV
jgi:hypothetical protein